MTTFFLESQVSAGGEIGAARRRHSRSKRCRAFGLLVALAIGVGSAQAGDGLNAGPLFDRFPLTLEPGGRTEALGPFFYAGTKDTEKAWGIPPLMSRTWDPVADFSEFDFAYPLLTGSRYGGERRWQLMQILSFAGGQDQADRDTRRFTLFPLYFQQRSADSNRNYTALFPIYGHLQNRLFRDEISFCLFPLYAESSKKGVVTENYLYPVCHWRHGNGVEGWQVWPLLGHEQRTPTFITNRFGTVELLAGYDTRFLLWPVFMNRDSGLGTENPQQERAVLPLFSSLRSPGRDMTTVLWPFFSHVTDRDAGYSEWQAPWPLIIFARGEGKTTSRVWPFYSHAENTNLESAFFLWPLYKYNRVHGTILDRERTRLLFFLYSDTIQKDVRTGEAQRRRDCWPLFTHRRDYNGNSRLQVFAPLEPLLPYSRSIERNYSPVWSIWRAEKNPRSGAKSQSLLWNLYRREKTPDSGNTSFLFGLFQYQSGPEGKRLRLFHIPVVKTRPPGKTASD